MIILVPMKHQVDDAVWTRVMEHYGDLAGPDQAAVFDRDRPQRLLRGMLDETGLEWIDLLDGLRRSARQRSEALYWPRDQHWNAAGHAAAARLIAGVLAGEEPLARLKGIGSE